MYLHSKSSSELQVGSLQEIPLANDRVIPVTRDGNGEGGENGVLDETSSQFKTKRQIILWKVVIILSWQWRFWFDNNNINKFVVQCRYRNSHGTNYYNKTTVTLKRTPPNPTFEYLIAVQLLKCSDYKGDVLTLSVACIDYYRGRVPLGGIH